MEGQSVTLGYWNIRGLGQMLRYLLEITETKYEDKQYSERDSWFLNDKQNLGMDFPNLPYIIDGDFKLTETQAIARYIIRRSGQLQLLGGNDPKTIAQVEMFQSLATELQKAVAGIVYNQEFEKIRESAYEEQIKPKLEAFEKYLEGKKFLTGEQFTLPDIWLFEYITEISLIYPEKYPQFKNLEALRQNVENIPQMKNYINSDRFLNAPFNYAPFAKWNNI